MFAKVKDLKLRDYQEAQQWRELKDCTFKPKINSNKINTFHKKRMSKSVMGIISRTKNNKPNKELDSFYQKLSDANPQTSLILGKDNNFHH